MKKYLYFIIPLFVASNSFSHGITNLWMMGYDNGASLPFGGTNIDFSSGTPNIYHVNRTMNFCTSNGIITNSNGNVLFYTNGVYIANALGDTMLNGDGLNPGVYTTAYLNDGLSITQADLIIPFPGDSMKYYLFHETIDNGIFSAFYFHTSVIDMTLDNGLGGVVNKNDTILTDVLVAGFVTGCKHANGRDWWVICHQYNSNRYFKFLVTPGGISAPYIQNIGKIMVNYGGGQTVFSPDGSKFAIYHAGDDLDIMDFDRCTGDFSNCVHVAIDDSAYAAGAAFSENSKVLYLSSTNYIYQFDLTAANIPSTKTIVAVWDSFYSPHPPFASTFNLSLLAPDQKIYVNCGNGTLDMHVINYPDSLGLACNVCQHCVHLPTYNAFTIPNFPNYFLGADSTSICDTLLTLNPALLKEEEIGLKLFPNPTTRVLYAALPEKFKNKELKIFNAFGQEMAVNFSFIKNGEYLEVNTTSLSQGVYFLELLSDREKVVKIFVKE